MEETRVNQTSARLWNKNGIDWSRFIKLIIGIFCIKYIDKATTINHRLGSRQTKWVGYTLRSDNIHKRGVKLVKPIVLNTTGMIS